MEEWQRNPKKARGSGVVPRIDEALLQSSPEPIKCELKATKAARIPLAAAGDCSRGREHICKVAVRAGTSGRMAAPAQVALPGIAVVPEAEAKPRPLSNPLHGGVVEEIKGLFEPFVARQGGLYSRAGWQLGAGAAQQRQEAAEGVHPGACCVRNLGAKHDGRHHFGRRLARSSISRGIVRMRTQSALSAEGGKHASITRCSDAAWGDSGPPHACTRSMG